MDCSFQSEAPIMFRCVRRGGSRETSTGDSTLDMERCCSFGGKTMGPFVEARRSMCRCVREGGREERERIGACMEIFMRRKQTVAEIDSSW